MHNIESRLVIGTGKCTVCRHVRALFFSLEIVQDGAVKGLKGKLALITYLCATLLSFTFSLLNLPPHSSPAPHNPSPAGLKYILVIDWGFVLFFYLVVFAVLSRFVIQLLTCDLVFYVFSWCKMILNVWFVLRWPCTVGGALKFKTVSFFYLILGRAHTV